MSGIAAAGFLYIRGRHEDSLNAIGLTGVIAFAVMWRGFAPVLTNLDPTLAVIRNMKQAGVPADAVLYWVDNRPDGRVAFYGNLAVKPVLDFDRLIAQRGGDWAARSLKMTVASYICDVLHGPQPVYLLLERRQLRSMSLLFDCPARELFHVDHGHLESDEDDWVVVTNAPVAPSVAPPHEQPRANDPSMLRSRS